MVDRVLQDVAGNASKASKCKSCGAPIRWALSVNGVSQPLDFEPNPKGNLVIVAKTTVRDGHAVVEDHVRKHDPLFDRAAAVFMPHHATCPQAHKWKRT